MSQRTSANSASVPQRRLHSAPGGFRSRFWNGTELVLVPPVARAVVGIPVSAVTSLGSARIEVTLGGTVIFSEGSFRPNPNVSFVGAEGGYVKFEVSAGAHAFSAREL